MDTIAANNDIWNRNVDILNLVTYGQLQLIAGDMRRSIRQMYGACSTILLTIGPLYNEKEERAVGIALTRSETSTQTRTVTVKGIRTKKYAERKNKMIQANRYMLYSENLDFDRETRHIYSQMAYNIIFDLSTTLLQDIEDLGFNKREKPPGAAAALSGS